MANYTISATSGTITAKLVVTEKSQSTENNQTELSWALYMWNTGTLWYAYDTKNTFNVVFTINCKNKYLLMIFHCVNKSPKVIFNMKNSCISNRNVRHIINLLSELFMLHFNMDIDIIKY